MQPELDDLVIDHMADFDRRLGSTEGKLENVRERLGKIDDRLTVICTTLTEIKSDLKWHWIVGGLVAAAYGIVLGWLFTFYIPNQISSKIPENLTERFAKLEQNVQNVQDRINRLTPATLNDLIPTPNVPPNSKNLTGQLRQASHVIDVALRARIPAAPESLAPLRMRIADILKSYKNDPRIRVAALSTDVRLEGYQVASTGLLNGLQPQTSPLSPEMSLGSMAYLSGFTMNCTYPTAHFLAAEKAPVVVFDVLVNICAQKLDGPRWINVDFKNSSIEYTGGPLYLADVTFVNCTFKFGDDINSRSALVAIRASNGAPVTLLIPAAE
jgi:hypothetical protein